MLTHMMWDMQHNNSDYDATAISNVSVVPVVGLHELHGAPTVHPPYGSRCTSIGTRRRYRYRASSSFLHLPVALHLLHISGYSTCERLKLEYFDVSQSAVLDKATPRYSLQRKGMPVSYWAENVAQNVYFMHRPGSVWVLVTLLPPHYIHTIALNHEIQP